MKTGSDSFPRVNITSHIKNTSKNESLSSIQVFQRLSMDILYYLAYMTLSRSWFPPQQTNPK